MNCCVRVGLLSSRLRLAAEDLVEFMKEKFATAFLDIKASLI